ncbi:hypothetical protein [uncultured Tenacibaculum sp.]|uniref:hypothetical protein n=1 Tax=uncultured Tenacibaculum sp. TaxID=174713 RepID=UPI00261BC402|nr:hypothetical protein [uncultured Tenacibaculum sp.]
MKKNLLNISGATILTSKEQKNLTGGISFDQDIRKCGCDCAGRVTGPFYCHQLIACPQVYTCDEESALS